MPIQIINPSTNKVEKSFEEMTEKVLDETITQSARAFDHWKTTSYADRTALLHKVAFLMREKRWALAGILTMEMGMLIGQAEQEIMLSADIFDYYATHGARFLADKILTTASEKAFVRYSPIGVLLGIEPRNFPFCQAARFAASNLMIGNTILIKQASNIPQCGIQLEELFRQAGAPTGLYTILLIADKPTSVLMADCRIKGVALTEGDAVDARIAAESGKHLKKSALESGGESLSGYCFALQEPDSNEFVDKKLMRIITGV